uniref:PB1 domain-containing protein n=1 Tax=Glossina brevipalpis TaxID=37001 RepID=A0A1A9W6V0_9MUSC
MELREDVVKVSYTINKNRSLHTFLRSVPLSYWGMKNAIEDYLFSKRRLPIFELRTFWRDEEGDEIEMSNDSDYEIFNSFCEKNRHIFVAPCTDICMPHSKTSSI